MTLKLKSNRKQKISVLTFIATNGINPVFGTNQFSQIIKLKCDYNFFIQFGGHRKNPKTKKTKKKMVNLQLNPFVSLRL